MGRTAIVIAVSYGLLGGLVVLLIGALVWSSTTTRHRQIDLRKLAEREKTWFAVVVVFLVGLLFGTIFFTPYGRGATDNGAQVVKVTGEQFAWLFPRAPIRAGRPVQFELDSPDVNHDFAVFDSHHKFLFQVQVIPGKTQLYRYTFTEPGRYTVECWEYCGLGHDTMTSSFTVTG